MTELFVKNKNRRRVVQNTVKNAYVPEYKRLGVDPQPARETDHSDFVKSQTKEKEDDKKRKRDREIISLIQKYRDGELSKEEIEEVLGTEVLEDAVIERKDRKIVNVGQNDELTWTKEKDSIITKKKVYNEPIEVEEILSPAQQALQEDDIEAAEDTGFSFSQLNISEYILIYEDDVIGVGSRADIYKLLTELLDSSENADISNFILLKRVDMKYGLLID